MTQPEDEETKEQPAYPEPQWPATPPNPAPLTPPGQAPLTPPAPAPLTPPDSPMPPPDWQQPPTQPSFQPPTQPSFQPPSGPVSMPPAQGWQGQPQPWQQGQQQPWQQGQQPQPGWGPGYGQPQQGWAPQAGWAPQQTQYGSSALVSLAGVVLILFGISVAILGGLTLTLGPEIGRFIRDNDVAVFGRQIDRETLRTLLSPMPGVLIVLGLLQLVVGAVVLSHRGWARWLGVLLSLLGVLIGIVAVSGSVALVPGVSVQLMISAVLLVGYAFVLLALIAGGSHFRKNYTGR